jgi:hypothetical protein
MLNRIVMHWTGGTHTASRDSPHYHWLIDGDGRRVPGRFPVEANAPGNIRPGRYAAHTLNLNGGAIGVSICGMHMAQETDPWRWTHYPVRPVQVETMVALVAELARQWRIPVDRRMILSHAEVQPTLGVRQRGKWDFNVSLPGMVPQVTGRDAVRVGDGLRAMITARLAGVPLAPPPPPPQGMPVLRQGASGDAVRDLQRLLRSHQSDTILADGQFGPKTHAAVVAYQRRRLLLPDGIVGRMTWAALLAE